MTPAPVPLRLGLPEDLRGNAAFVRTVPVEDISRPGELGDSSAAEVPLLGEAGGRAKRSFLSVAAYDQRQLLQRLGVAARVRCLELFDEP